ncbi:ABC transporter permease family protein [Nocardiopsis flavescens]|uniref:hypothetical protein n=1 Tax=Nocardiopsis flavescens TaxID=758803 RepID=UPI001C4A1DDA|nr:hypothetical protein [Nocardiopsis flavescens]
MSSGSGAQRPHLSCATASTGVLGVGEGCRCLLKGTAAGGSGRECGGAPLSDEDLHPLSPGLYSWNAAAPIDPDFSPLVVIGSLPALLPLVIAFLLLQRFWRSGLTAGSVK